MLQHTMQHTATHCNTLQHTATHCNTLQHTAAYSNTLQHTATHCNTLQHTATHCNTLQHAIHAHRAQTWAQDLHPTAQHRAQHPCKHPPVRIFKKYAHYQIYCVSSTGRRRIVGCLIFVGHFPQKSPVISGSFAGNNLRLQASYGFSPPCIKFTAYKVNTNTLPTPSGENSPKSVPNRLHKMVFRLTFLRILMYQSHPPAPAQPRPAAAIRRR